MPERAAAPPAHGRRVLVTAAFLALVICPLVVVAIASTSLFRAGGRVLEVEMRTSSGNTAEIFWSADYIFSASARAAASINQEPGAFARVRFRLPRERFEVLGFEPMNGEGDAVIRGIRILDDHGRVVRTIDPLVLRPFHEVTRVLPVADGVRVLTTPGATNPMMILTASWLAGPSAWRGVQFVTPLGLAWIGLAALALLATAIGVVMKDAMRESFDRRTVLWLAMLFLIVVWAKALVLLQHPVPVPFWDQWDGEGAMLYIPWWHDGLTWRQMFALHNEHRIFFSRLLAVALLVLNGQWDPHLQILVNAVILALAAVVLAVVLWMAGGRRRLPLVVALVALALAPPLGLENSLHGFQSAFYLLLLFSLLAIWLMIAHEPGTAAWALGVACAFCTLFTVAGGALVIVPVGLASLLRAVATPRRWRQLAITVVALAAVAAVAAAAMSPPIAYHEPLRAVSWPAFIRSLGRNLALPWTDAPALAPILWLPLAVAAGVVLRRRLQSKDDERFLLALGAWVLCQAAAIAYARGGDGVAPASRYLDLLGLGLVLNSLALAAWLAAGKRPVQIRVAVLLCVWLGGLTAGVVSLSRETLATHGRQRERGAREHVRNVRAFVATQDVDELLDKTGPRDLPYNNAWLLANWLQHPYVRQVLPAIVRPPLDLQPAGSSGGFVAGHAADRANRRVTFDSYGDGRETNASWFESQPLACSNFRHLRFEVAGAARDGGLDLGVRDASGRVLKVSPAPGTRPGWTGAFVRCPPGNFSVVASDRSPLSWMAFTPPTEIAAGSMFAAVAIERAPLLGYAALACGGLALASALAARSTQRPALTPAARGLMNRLMSSLNPDGEPIACAICGRSDTEPEYVKYGYAIGRCRGCGLVYANPRAPAPRILSRYSPDYFWKEYLPSLGIVDGKFDLAPFDARYAPILRLLAARTPGRRLLEIGAGAGLFLKAAERAGWQVSGIELSDAAARFAIEQLGLDIRTTPAEAMSVGEGAYDAVAMFETIEHLFDPRSVLTAAARTLTPGGTLVVSTPNYDAASRHLLGSPWAVLSPMEHVYYFREASLRQLLEATGFEDVQFDRVHEGWGPMETANFHYTHAPTSWRARGMELLVRGGGMTLARLLQRAGRQDTLLCFARRRP